MNSDRTSTNTKVKQRTLLKIDRYKLKKTTQNIKEELNKNMENLTKKESNRNPGSNKFF
jgi:predicted ATP-grasp superfamily ATP-dependent carboligase